MQHMCVYVFKEKANFLHCYSYTWNAETSITTYSWKQIKEKKYIHQQKENKEKFIIFLVVVEQIMTKQVIHQVFEHTGNKHKNIPLEHINVCV